MIKFHFLSPAQYANARFNLLNDEEGLKGTPYVDTKGIPTIGIGANLRIETNATAALTFALGDIKSFTGPAVVAEQAYRDQLSAVFDQTWNSTSALNKKINEILKTRANDPALVGHTLATEFSITDDQAQQLFLNTAGTYELKVAQFATTITTPFSAEQLALFSLAFNGKSLLGPGLKAAMASGDRAEAWYEIRYDSNGDELLGIAKRRYYESQIFGAVDDPGPMTLDEARDLLTTRSRHIQNITTYDLQYGSAVALANRDYSQSESILGNAVQESDEIFDQAKALYYSTYGRGHKLNEVILDYKNITGGVLSTTETNELNSKNYNITDGALMMGGSGDDTIVGSAGNDVIWGQAGNDLIDGGLGNDFVEYSGRRTDYGISFNSLTNTWTVVDNRLGSPDGTDTLRNVENIEFESDETSFVLNALGSIVAREEFGSV